jgi:phage-related minor tail protein
MSGTDLKLALRMSADFKETRAELGQLEKSLGDVSDTARTTATSLDAIDASGAQEAAAKLRLVGESAEQQTSRLRAMVAASMEQRDALTSVAAASQQAGTAAREAAGDWQATAAAQNASMQAHTNAERAAREHAAAEIAAAEAAQKAAADFDRESKELGELLGKIDPVIRELERLDALEKRLGASRKAGAIDNDTYDVYAAKLHAQRAALNGQSQGMRMAGISAGQYQQAMRQLPMQITDITTSLATGMPVWMVAIQQGGQIKDSFGGWGAASRALVSSINPMTAAIAAATAVVGGYFIALESATRDHAEFDRALILTGNYAGQTSASMDDLARSVGSRDLGQARDILAGLAATGRINAGAFESVGKAAIAMAAATGQSTEQIVAQFSRMEGDAAKWAREMNEQYHVLDTATLSQIENLQEQGRVTEALELISNAVFDSMTERTQELDENLTTLQRTINAVGKAFTDWEGLKDFASETAASFAAMSTSVKEMSTGDLQALLRQRSQAAVFTTNPDRFNQQLDEIAAIQAELTARQGLKEEKAAGLEQDQKADDALADISKRRLENLTKEERKQRDLNALVEDYIAAWNGGKNAAEARLQGVSFDGGRPSGGQFEIDRQRIEERYAETPKTPKKSAEEKALEKAQKEAAKQAADDAKAQQRAFDETERAYESLSDALRTPVEAAVETAQARIETLNAALKQGTIDAATYRADLERIGDAGFDTAPAFGGLSPEVGGIDSEFYRLDEAAAELENWRSEQLALLEQFRQNKIGTEQQWNDRELLIAQQHQDAKNRLQQAQDQLLMTQTTATFESMADIARNAAGEQSEAYKVLFAISKGFATAQAAASLAVNISKASELGFPANIPAIAAAFAQGAQIAQLLSSAQYADGGRVRGPGTETSDSIPAWLSNNEFVTRAAVVRQPGALPFLDDFNARGMSALADWSARVRHATGGLAGVPAPSMPSPGLGASELASPGAAASVNNRMRVYIVQNEDELAQRLAQHPATEKAVVRYAGQNGNAIRAEW